MSSKIYYKSESENPYIFPDFAVWIAKGKDVMVFVVRLGASLALGNIGATSLKKHVGYDKHKALVQAHTIQIELKFHVNIE